MGKGYEFNCTVEIEDESLSLTEAKRRQLQESAEISESSIVVEIEAIHDITTANHTTYTAAELRKSIDTWLNPHNKPVLTHHQSRNGEPIGRVIDARFTHNTTSGRPGVILTAEISDQDAIQKIKDNRYLTVSVGGHADHAYCSVCDADWVAEGWCEHRPGNEYEGKTAHLILTGLEFKEVSFVNVPADKFAQIIDSDDSENEESLDDLTSITATESNDDESLQGGGYSMKSEEKIKILEEKVNTKEERVEVLEEKVESLEGKLESSEAKAENDEEKIKTLEDEKELLEEEMEDLIAENENFKKKQHEALAEKVVDKKIAMDKVKEDSREDLVSQHIERSEDSLNDSLADLRLEEKLAEEDEEEGSEIGEEAGNEGLSQEEEGVEIEEGNEEDEDFQAKLKKYAN